MSSKKTTSPAFETLVADLLVSEPSLQRGSLFGMPCVKKHGKACLGSYDGCLVAKLAGDPHAAALALDGAVLFDPSGKGRPMKAWVVIPPSELDWWPEFAAHALDELS